MKLQVSLSVLLPHEMQDIVFKLLVSHHHLHRQVSFNYKEVTEALLSGYMWPGFVLHENSFLVN